MWLVFYSCMGVLTIAALDSYRLPETRIADEMCVSVRTVKGYRNAVCEKLQLKTRTGLAMYAIKNGIVTLD